MENTYILLLHFTFSPHLQRPIFSNTITPHGILRRGYDTLGRWSSEESPSNGPPVVVEPPCRDEKGTPCYTRASKSKKHMHVLTYSRYIYSMCYHRYYIRSRIYNSYGGSLLSSVLPCLQRQKNMIFRVIGTNLLH